MWKWANFIFGKRRVPSPLYQHSCDKRFLANNARREQGRDPSLSWAIQGGARRAPWWAASAPCLLGNFFSLSKLSWPGEIRLPPFLLLSSGNWMSAVGMYQATRVLLCLWVSTQTIFGRSFFFSFSPFLGSCITIRSEWICEVEMLEGVVHPGISLSFPGDDALLSKHISLPTLLCWLWQARGQRLQQQQQK